MIFNEGLVSIAKNYLKKGAKVYLEGTLQTRKRTDKDGQEKYSTEVVLQGYGATLACDGTLEQPGPKASPEVSQLTRY